MANVFYTKKAKAKMRARRRKLQKLGEDAGKKGGKESKDIKHNKGSEQPEKETNERAGSNHEINEKTETVGRKRSADQMANGHRFDSVKKSKTESGHEEQNRANGENTNQIKKGGKNTKHIIEIPLNLSSKEAKKFRKEERRKARAQGIGEDQIKFITEGEEEQSDHERHQENNDKQHDTRDKKSTTSKPPLKHPKQSFPRINDLLTQHAHHLQLQTKLTKQKSLNSTLPPSLTSRYLALDCEMVGIGPDSRQSALARVSLVDWNLDVIYDTFVRVEERVTDFRTHVSGVRPKDISVHNPNAKSHAEVREAVGKLLLNKILVGHALKNDLSALLLTHPKSDVRDTAKYKPFMRATGRSGGKLRPRKLRDLVYENLGRRIQVEGESHCSVEDARASMELFWVVRGRWEKELEEKNKGKGGKRKK